MLISPFSCSLFSPTMSGYRSRFLSRKPFSEPLNSIQKSLHPRVTSTLTSQRQHYHTWRIALGHHLAPWSYLLCRGQDLVFPVINGNFIIEKALYMTDLSHWTSSSASTQTSCPVTPPDSALLFFREHRYQAHKYIFPYKKNHGRSQQHFSISGPPSRCP